MPIIVETIFLISALLLFFDLSQKIKNVSSDICFKMSFIEDHNFGEIIIERSVFEGYDNLR